MRLRAAGLALAATAGAAGAAPDPGALTGFARCLGYGDAYAAAAAEYGYDTARHRRWADARQAELVASGDAGAEAIAAARDAARADHTALLARLARDGRMEGPDWEESVRRGHACDALGDALRAGGVITEAAPSEGKD